MTGVSFDRSKPFANLLPPNFSNMIQLFKISTTGPTHIRSGKGNQDSACVLNYSGRGSLAVATVADGHGAPAHDLSEHGSRIATNTACDISLKRFANADRGPQSIFLRDHFEQTIREDFVFEWRERVLKHAAGLTPSAAVTPERSSRPADFSRYGTTILVAATDGDTISYGQIGDGTILTVGSMGLIKKSRSQSSPVIDPQTHSLSSANTDELWVFETLRRGEQLHPNDDYLTILVTDGIENALLKTNQLEQLALDLYTLVASGPDGWRTAVENLPTWITTWAEHSGDDATIALMWMPCEPGPMEKSGLEDRPRGHRSHGFPKQRDAKSPNIRAGLRPHRSRRQKQTSTN